MATINYFVIITKADRCRNSSPLSKRNRNQNYAKKEEKLDKIGALTFCSSCHVGTELQVFLSRDVYGAKRLLISCIFLNNCIIFILFRSSPV